MLTPQDDLLKNSMNKEIRELESHIDAEGDTDLNNLKANLEKEQSIVASKKEESKTLLKLLDVVNTMVDMAERYDDKKRQVKDRKEELQVSYYPTSNELHDTALTLLIHTQRNRIGYAGNDPRDLKQVESDITKAGASKEKAYNEIGRLNEEQRSINERISRM